MTIAELRKSLAPSQEAFAALLGLSSKSYVSEIEKAEREGARTVCSVRVALKIEELSEGQIKAADLNPDVGLVEQARGLTGEAA
jgi:transcriptional regulator with XRE-family HTH domain